MKSRSRLSRVLSDFGLYLMVAAGGALVGVGGVNLWYLRHYKTLPGLTHRKPEYQRNLEEVLRKLRKDTKVRMVKLVLPGRILDYQRSPAGAPSTMRLRPRGTEIPVIAVSKHAETLLNQNAIRHVNPANVPTYVLEASALPLSPSALKDYLLLPDFSGNNVNAFYFQKP